MFKKCDPTISSNGLILHLAHHHPLGKRLAADGIASQNDWLGFSHTKIEILFLNSFLGIFSNKRFSRLLRDLPARF